MVKNNFIKFILLISYSFISLDIKSQISYGSNNGKYVTINETKLYYEEYGKGIPLLMLHGGCGDISDFKYVIPNLSKKFRVIIPDAPGLGRSDYANSVLSYQLLANYQSKFIDFLKLDSVYVIGWSDGANAGLILAKNRPDKIKKLIVSGANYTLKGFKKHALMNCKKIADTNFVKKELKGWIKNYQKKSSKNWTRYILEVGQMWFMEEYFPKSVLKSIKCPTLVMYGDKDIYTLEHGLEIKNAIPKSKFLVIPNCPHDVFTYKPQLFINSAIKFLNQK